MVEREAEKNGVVSESVTSGNLVSDSRPDSVSDFDSDPVSDLGNSSFKEADGLSKPNVPVPPPPPERSTLPQPPVLQEPLHQDEISGSSEDSDAGEEFQFEGEIDSKISSRQLLIIVGGIAVGIFLCATILIFALKPSKPKTSAHELKLPPAVTNESEGETADSGSKGEDLNSEEESEEFPVEDEESGEKESDVKEEMEDSGEVSEKPFTDSKGEENPQKTGIDEPENGDFSTLMQSSMGKKLTGVLPEKVEGDSVSESNVKETGEETKSESEGEVSVGVGNSSEAGNSSEKNASTEADGASAEEMETPSEISEFPEDGVKSTKSDEKQTEEEPDALQFSRKKRKRSYSGDPVLDFDEVTREAEVSGKGDSEKKETEKMEGQKVKSEGEEPVNVPSPTDEKVEENPEAPVLQAFRIKPPAIEYLPPEAAAKLAVPLESISIQKRPVTALLQMATQMSGERLAADWQKLQMLGVSMETPVSLKLEGTSLREALDTGLYSVNLGVIPAGLTLRIGGWEAAEITRLAVERGEKPEKHVLNLEDLAATLNAETAGKSGLTELERLIPQFVHPALWEDANGPGRLAPNVAKSRVTISQQFPSVIQEVELFFDKIRCARNMETRTMPTNPSQRRLKLYDGTEICDCEPIQRYKISEKARFTPIDCDLSDGTTLRSALQEVMRCVDSKIIFDEEAIARIPITSVFQDADVPDFEGNRRKLPKSILDVPCVYRFEGITMEEAVGTILKSVPLLCYPVARNEFFLTTHDEAQRKMLVDFFPVGDLVTNAGAVGTVLNGICETIEPDSWIRKGGAGAIYFDVPSRSLIVRQNPYVLYQIEMFLKHYRATKNSDQRLEEKNKE